MSFSSSDPLDIPFDICYEIPMATSKSEAVMASKLDACISHGDDILTRITSVILPTWDRIPDGLPPKDLSYLLYRRLFLLP